MLLQIPYIADGDQGNKPRFTSETGCHKNAIKSANIKERISVLFIPETKQTWSSLPPPLLSPPFFAFFFLRMIRARIVTVLTGGKGGSLDSCCGTPARNSCGTRRGKTPLCRPNRRHDTRGWRPFQHQ